MADDDKKTATTEEDEGFDLGAALDGVQQAVKTVKIYLDAQAADKAFQLNGALLEARADAKDGVEQVMSIAEEAPTLRLERELKGLEERSEAIDAELAALEEQLAQPEHATDASLFQRYSSLKKEQETTLERWAELSLELEEA